MLSTSYYDDASSDDTMTSSKAAATNDATMMTSETATANVTEMTSRSLLTSLTPPPPPAADMLVGEQIGWYTVIAVLSALVLVGLCFTVCRLVMKAGAHEKASKGDWRRDSLLFSRKDSVIPISLHFNPTTDDTLHSS